MTPVALELLWRATVFTAGFWLVIWTLRSAIRAFVLPRSERVWLQRIVFRFVFIFFRIRLRKANSYLRRDAIHAMFAPVGLLLMPVVIVAVVVIGYTAMFYAVGVTPLKHAFILSGSSLFTLGFEIERSLGHILLIFSEATLGLGIIALIISYLPTMYAAFSQRERMVAMLEVRAGDPPSGLEMLKRFQRLQRLDALDDMFAEWEVWFAQLEESHTSLPALVFFRSPQPNRSWITAAGAILDGAALYNSCIAPGPEGSYRAALCIRAGYIALRQIADYFGMAYDAKPAPNAPISIGRDEFEEVYRQLQEIDVPLKADVDEAWRNYAGWRVNYDAVLLQLANLTMAPYAPWSSDRSLAGTRPLLAKKRKRRLRL